jgi:hypothetical protein
MGFHFTQNGCNSWISRSGLTTSLQGSLDLSKMSIRQCADIDDFQVRAMTEFFEFCIMFEKFFFASGKETNPNPNRIILR